MSADVVVKFLADTTQLSSGLREVEGTGQKLTGFAKGIVASIGGAALATGIYKSVQAASDLNETVSASQAVFGKSARGINDWASGASSDFGQSKQQALESATAFGSMFNQLGIGIPTATKMSKSMVELASDFASFKNVDVASVLEAQQSAFRGEYDALQKFVPTISAATVETKAMAMTGKENASQLTAQEKATATYRLMIDNAGKAMGDFDRTSEGAANKQRELSAQMADLSASLGQALLPVFQRVLQVVSTVADAFSALPAPVQTVVAVFGILAATMGIFWSAGINVVKAVKGIAEGVVSAAKAIPALVTWLGTLTLAQAAATVGITLLVAGLALLVVHFLNQKSAADKAAEAGTSWAKTQVENARASQDTATALATLLPTSRAVTSALKDATDAQAALKDKMAATQSGTVEGRNAYMALAGQAADLDVKIASLTAKHQVLAPEVAKLRREQELATIAEAAQRAELDALGAAQLGVATATDTARKAVTELTNAVLASQGGAVAYEAAQLQVESAQIRVNEAVAKFGPDSLEARQAANDLAAAKIGAANAAYTLQANEGELAAVLRKDGVGGLQTLRASLLQTIATHGDATGAVGAQVAKIDELIAQANKAGGINKTAKIDADTDEGTRKVKKFNDDANEAAKPRTATITAVKAGQSIGFTGYASGGIVPGPVGRPQLAVVHGGERVIPVGRAASGSGGTTYNYTVQVSVDPGTSPARVGAAVVDQIRAYERVAGKAWRK